MATWTICPECKVGRGADHLLWCSLRHPPPVRNYGGTPCAAITPGRPDDGEPEAVGLRQVARAAQAQFENDSDHLLD
jgi:hypothetical protein